MIKWLHAEGFNDAIIGYGTHYFADVVIYDYEKCIKVLMNRDEMTYDEANEFMKHNVCGVWNGESTPVFLKNATNDEFDE